MKAAKPKRPLSFKLFVAWIAILGGLSLTWSFLRYQQIPLLDQFGLPPNWPVVILGVVWGVGLLAGAVGLWLRWEPARWAVLFLVPAYYLTQGVYSALTTQASYGRNQIWPYTIFALLVIAYSTWFLTRRRTREQFGK
jgi:hypothetical protein